MVAVPTCARNPLLRLMAGVALLLAVACAPVSNVGGLGGGLGRGETVQVALLVPSSSTEGGPILAQSLENAARLAISDLQGAASSCASTTPPASRRRPPTPRAVPRPTAPT